MVNSPTLPLTKAEKNQLRKAKIKMSDIRSFSAEYLVDLFDTTWQRANELKALAMFQTIPSIGVKLAENIVYQLNIYSLDELKDKDASRLFDQLEEKRDVWIDSCVEDQLRCVVNYANDPRSDKQWFAFTETRKKYRESHGYPKTRPDKAWFDN